MNLECLVIVRYERNVQYTNRYDFSDVHSKEVEAFVVMHSRNTQNQGLLFHALKGNIKTHNFILFHMINRQAFYENKFSSFH